MLKLLSALVVCLILTGLYFRKDRKRHIPLMLSAFGLDLGLLLYVEITRHAIDATLHNPHPFVILHVSLSVLMLLLYVLQLYSGFRLLKTGQGVKLHKTGAVCFVILRVGNLVTSLYAGHFIPG